MTQLFCSIEYDATPRKIGSGSDRLETWRGKVTDTLQRPAALSIYTVIRWLLAAPYLKPPESRNAVSMPMNNEKGADRRPTEDGAPI